MKTARAVRRVALEKLDAGEITEAQYGRVMAAMERPHPRRKVKDFIRQQATRRRKIKADGDVESIDWDKLLEFIRQIFQMILDFISAFSAI